MGEESTLSKLAYDVFGPSAKHVGDELILPGTKWAAANIKRMLQTAAKRKAQLGLDGGTVPPRVIPTLLQSAAVCDDPLVTSYLGGVLCSARTRNGRDDRAIAVTRLIDGLSSYALRAHCIVYASLLRQQEEKMASVQKWMVLQRGITVVFDEAEFQKQMAFQPGEDANVILEHAFVNLSANDLTMQGIRAIEWTKPKVQIRFMHLTLRGVELFCWGIGAGQLGVEHYFTGQVTHPEADALAIVPRAVKLGIVSWS